MQDGKFPSSVAQSRLADFRLRTSSRHTVNATPANDAMRPLLPIAIPYEATHSNITEYEISESKRIRTNKHISECEQCDNFVERVKWKTPPILHFIPAHPLGDTHMAREEHPHWLEGKGGFRRRSALPKVHPKVAVTQEDHR
jgi:hypothetical protein